MKILNLSENHIKEIYFLENDNLIIEELNLGQNCIKDFSPLLSMKNLELINIEKQYIKILDKIESNYYDYNFYNTKKIKYNYIIKEEVKTFLDTIKLLEKKVKKCFCKQNNELEAINNN